MIDSFQNSRDYASALLLSAIYVHMRLKSLLTDKLSRHDKEKWQVTVRELNDLRLSFYAALRMCRGAGIISHQECGDLDALKKKRDSLVHETVMWRTMSRKDANEIIGFCNSAKRFLRRTSQID